MMHVPNHIKVSSHVYFRNSVTGWATEIRGAIPDRGRDFFLRHWGPFSRTSDNQDLPIPIIIDFED
jgi:hypothetical protein